MTEEIPVLRLENIGKRFGGLHALSGVTLSLYKGEILGLIGPNGAGKSTLFNVITAIYKPNTGDVYLEDRKITGCKPHRICHLGVARTFQLVRPFLSMTAFENVMVGAIFGTRDAREEPSKRALDALKLVELIDKKDMITANMTLSDRRLLGVARSLASMPLVSLLDEPMAGLNPSETKKMMEVIAKAREQRGLAILWVEHKMDAIFNLCDRIIVFKQGQKIADGKPQEIAKNQMVIEAYLGKKASH